MEIKKPTNKYASIVINKEVIISWLFLWRSHFLTRKIIYFHMKNAGIIVTKPIIKGAKTNQPYNIVSPPFNILHIKKIQIKYIYVSKRLKDCALLYLLYFLLLALTIFKLPSQYFIICIITWRVNIYLNL